MAFILNIFSITILNNFYKSKSSKDFEIVPTLNTQKWFNKQKVRVVKQPNTISLIWLAENYDNPLDTFQQKTQEVTWSFIMTLNNKTMFNLFDLETGYTTKQVYYFHNRHKHDQKTLHQDEYVSPMDLVNISDVTNYPKTLGFDVFAIIDIDLAQWAKMEQQANQNTRSLLTPYPYEIHIQSRPTFWRYHFIDSHKKLNKTIKILDQDGISYFNEAKVSTDNPTMYSIEAHQPIRFCDQYDYYFSLYKSDTDEDTKEKILLEHLPYPKYDSIKQDKHNKKIYYSDIVVHI